nr:RING-H2 finger protein ATL67-like [Ipomoea trifida]
MRPASQALSFFFLLIICTFICKKTIKMFPGSAFLNYVVFVATQLKWAWDFLLLQSFCQARPGAALFKFDVAAVSGGGGAELGVRRFEGGAGEVECAVCLCKIEEGEEVRDLRCEHVFHKVCLDRWLGTGRSTCPLCRNHVKPPRAAALDELHRHQEVIVFDVFGGRRRDRCTWWLR